MMKTVYYCVSSTIDTPLFGEPMPTYTSKAKTYGDLRKEFINRFGSCAVHVLSADGWILCDESNESESLNWVLDSSEEEHLMVLGLIENQQAAEGEKKVTFTSVGSFIIGFVLGSLGTWIIL